MKKTLFAMVIMSALALSCKDDDDSPAPTRMQLLTERDWVLTALEVDGEVYAREECSLDDAITFSEEGDLFWDYGTEKCSASAPSQLTGTWEFRKNYNQMIWDLEGDEVRFDILELTTTAMRLEVVEDGTIMVFDIVDSE